MAIQLNDRDLLIFQLIDEHRVLLEKHISWFISGEDKPVLIRDRLRKLFYLDYLLCHRHGTKLPWWTTPTKPLVYMLSGISRSAANCSEEALDLYDSEVQRHFLEVANLRMLGLIDQKDEKLTKFHWTTVKTEAPGKTVDAFVTFTQNARAHKIAIVNHPALTAELVPSIDEAIKSGAEHVLLVSRDDAHQAALQKLVAQSGSLNAKRCLFATHHEIYREGLVATNWGHLRCSQSDCICETSRSSTCSSMGQHAGSHSRIVSLELRLLTTKFVEFTDKSECIDCEVTASDRTADAFRTGSWHFENSWF